MSYEVLMLRRASKQLANLPSREYQRVKASILQLGEDPRPYGCLRLTGRSGWRIRIGNYRVIYEIDDPKTTVTILDVGDRRDIYN
jgi:mRNA interferase RelE/StbE